MVISLLWRRSFRHGIRLNAYIRCSGGRGREDGGGEGRRGGVVGSTMQRLFDSTTRGNASTYLIPNRCSDLHSWGTSVDMDVHAIGLRASDRLIVDEWINFAMFTTRDHISTCVGSRW